MTYVVATSRCPISHDHTGGRETIRKNVGGVATALHLTMKKNGGVWICWGDGNADSEYPEEEYEGYKIIRITLDKSEKRGFYDEYSNGTLWPLFHYFRERISVHDGAYRHYASVNMKFAHMISKYADSESIVWVHDYQLALVPGMLRKLNLGNFTIFTWHIPWVSSEFYNILPQARELVASITESDMITFHTELYRKNFRESCESLLEPDRSIDDYSFAFSLGVDAQYYGSYPATTDPTEKIPSGRSIIFSLDRLDYTKGLVNRVLTIERLLKNHPDVKREFVYVMVVTPSRTSVSEYVKMKQDLETQIARVNGTFGDLYRQPIINHYRRISDRALKSFYRAAHIALITPLVDGLNLVCKEFVAATKKGVLILSKFAGSAHNLPQALLVNPNDIEEVAENIYMAMNMRDREIMGRLGGMKNSVYRRDLVWWISKITGTAEKLQRQRQVQNTESNAAQ